MTQGHPRESAAFEGLRVVELSEGIAGPFAARMLAAQGAEVIKVERPAVGDVARTFGPFPDGRQDPEQSGYFHFLNMGKKSLTLDLEHEAGRSLFGRLVEPADVLIESSMPGTMERLGLSFQALHEANPGLVMVSVTDFGQDGPYKDYQSTELILHALSGEMYLAGDPDNPPLMKGGHMAQHHGGLHAFIATMSALHARRKTGEGQHVDVSTVEGWTSIAGMFLKSYTYRDEVPTRKGDNDGFPGGLRRCKDGWVVISGRGARRDWWPAFVQLIDTDALRVPEFETDEGRRANHDKINAIYNEWLLQQEKQDLYRRAQSAGLAAAYVCDADDLLGSPQLAARSYFEQAELGDGHGFSFPSMPYRMGRATWKNGRAPRLGEHNEEIFRQRLGIPASAYESLRQQAVV